MRFFTLFNSTFYSPLFCFVLFSLLVFCKLYITLDSVLIISICFLHKLCTTATVTIIIITNTKHETKQQSLYCSCTQFPFSSNGGSRDYWHNNFCREEWKHHSQFQLTSSYILLLTRLLQLH